MEWCSSKQNVTHAINNGLSNLYTNRIKIYKIDILTGEILSEYHSATGAIIDGYKNSAISMCLRGSHLTAYGHFWHYADTYDRNKFVSPLKILMERKNISLLRSCALLQYKDKIKAHEYLKIPLPQEQIKAKL